MSISSSLALFRVPSFTPALAAILAATQPRVVYTHNPADKHRTHLAVVVPVIQAIRALPRAQRRGHVRAVRLAIWIGDINQHSPPSREPQNIPPQRILRMAQALCFAT